MFSSETNCFCQTDGTAREALLNKDAFPRKAATQMLFCRQCADTYSVLLRAQDLESAPVNGVVARQGNGERGGESRRFTLFMFRANR